MTKQSTLALAAVLAVGLCLPAQAQIERPECIAPAQPGGGFDLTCRVAQQGLESQLGEPMPVTFMPGGIGAVAFNLFNTTRTDDPNAIVAFSTGSLLNIVTGKFGQLTEKDVRWLATAGADFGAVVVKADSHYQTLDDLMQAIKADPAGVVIGAGGSVGSQDWMKAALLLRAVGADPRKMRYVAFDGGGEAIAACSAARSRSIPATSARWRRIWTAACAFWPSCPPSASTGPSPSSRPPRSRATTSTGPSCAASTWARTSPTRTIRSGCALRRGASHRRVRADPDREGAAAARTFRRGVPGRGAEPDRPAAHARDRSRADPAIGGHAAVRTRAAAAARRPRPCARGLSPRLPIEGVARAWSGPRRAAGIAARHA